MVIGGTGDLDMVFMMAQDQVAEMEEAEGSEDL